MTRDDPSVPQRALLAAVDLDDPAYPIAHELAEFAALARAAGASVVGEIVQRLPRVDPATLFGSGKVGEIAERAVALDAQMLFLYNDVRPRQRTNLEKRLTLPIIDRTMLILDIFAQHARSREGRLQVELAQLRHRQANLIGSSAALSRLGGGVGTRGPGETKLETDRRRIAHRITILGRALEDVRRQRALRRTGGRDPLIALVGYTNAGKSSLLNRLAGIQPGAENAVLVADQPFATLDPTVRRTYIGGGRSVRVADTVGFVTRLPETLVTAFRATLEELAAADLLIHVLDASNLEWPRQRASVEAVLVDLGVADRPTLVVANKIDRAVGTDLPSEALPLSAVTGEGLEALRAALLARFGATRPA